MADVWKYADLNKTKQSKKSQADCIPRKKIPTRMKVFHSFQEKFPFSLFCCRWPKKMKLTLCWRKNYAKKENEGTTLVCGK